MEVAGPLGTPLGHGKSKRVPEKRLLLLRGLCPSLCLLERRGEAGQGGLQFGSGGDGIPVELFQILKDDAVKVLHSTCQQIWKTQQ